MRAIVQLVAVFLVLAQCSCSDTSAVSTTTDPATTHFWFNYTGMPQPGRRIWMRTEPEVWVELYPNGDVSRYKRTASAAVAGEQGTVVKKMAGDLQKTGAANDGSFEVFIPDRGAKQMVLFFRMAGGPDEAKWRALAPITEIR